MEVVPFILHVSHLHICVPEDALGNGTDCTVFLHLAISLIYVICLALQVLECVAPALHSLFVN